jgi:hypothetical protein
VLVGETSFVPSANEFASGNIAANIDIINNENSFLGRTKSCISWFWFLQKYAKVLVLKWVLISRISTGVNIIGIFRQGDLQQ